ncbi:MAG: TRAP transporter small permease [Burkholderiaceae bacterium]|nr:TRAP transporter small permease [Burkholderiaceae bacterium]
MKRMLQIVRGIESLFDIATTVLVLGIMVIVFSDVVLRYFFNWPLIWAYDLISMYLMAGAFFLSLSSTYAGHAHVRIDIFEQNAPPPMRRASEILTCLVGIALFGMIAWLGAERAWDNWVQDDRLGGLIAWPTWVSAVLVPTGCGLLVLRLVYRITGLILGLLTGRDWVEPIPRSDEGESLAE